MTCHECSQNRERLERCEEAEQLLLLFQDTFSRLAQRLADIDAERMRRYYEANPPPDGAKPLERRRYLLVPIERIMASGT